MTEINKINVISAYEAKNRGYWLIKNYYYTTPEEVKSEFSEPVIVERKMLQMITSKGSLTDSKI